MRGSRKRGSFRRRLAGFLAACLVVTNLQGLTFAYGAEEDVIEEQAQLIQLDMSAMQSAVQDAAESGVLITAPEMAASAANAWVDLPFTKPAYELSPGNIEALLADETELPAHTSLRIFLEPLEENEEDEAEENGSYVITGDENLIFLIENDGSEAQAYQIQFGDKVTDVIVAESRKELRKELKGEDEEEEFVGGAGAVESTEAPVVESTEATAEAPTEESTEAVTEESSQAAPEESTEESSQAESEESTEAGPNAGTEESTEAENESESQAETEESSNAETEESSQAETAEPETEETTEAVTEETSPAETTPETSPEESTPVAESEGETEAETSTEAVTEATTEGTTSESTETETETEEATETVTETATEAATDSASVDSLEDAVAETEDAGNEDGGDEPVVVVEEEADVPEEGQVAPENESPIAALWKTTVNFLTGNITAHAAGTATPPEATETEPESESDTENQNQGNSGSNGGSGSAGGSQAEDDTDVPVATDGNADQKPGKEKIFKEAGGLDGLTTLNIDWVNVLVDGGLKQANGGMFRMMMAAAADAVGGEKAVAMFKVPMSAVLATPVANASSLTNGVTLYNYASGYDDDEEVFQSIDGNSGLAQKVINTYIRQENEAMTLRFNDGWTKDGWGDINDDYTVDGDNYELLDSKTYNQWQSKPGKNDITIKHNITQNMPEDKTIVDFDVLFPEAQTPMVKTVEYDGTEYHAIDVYPNVNVDKFLKKGSDGYYKYDSSSVGARYDINSNILDRYPHAWGADDNEKGFWPFNNTKQYYFGMTVGFDFYKREDGKFVGEPMKFSFSGDDDVWVYLTSKDGNIDFSKLVLDLGGIHGRVDGEINFATGLITYSAAKLGNNEYGDDLINNIPDEKIHNRNGNNRQRAYAYLYDSSTAKERLGSDCDEKYKFIEYLNMPTDSAMYHLHFYYLERGAGKSNCMLSYNLPAVPTAGIEVSKQVKAPDSVDLSGEKYGFWLVWADTLEDLKKYINSGEEGSGVHISNKKYIEIEAGGAVKDPISLDELQEGVCFYIKEDTPAPKVSWSVAENPDTVEEVGKEDLGNLKDDPYRSPIYRVTSDKKAAIRFDCVNEYEGLTPEYHKQAWKNYDKRSIYDIVLDVTGDTHQRQSLQNPKVMDHIDMTHLEFSDKVSINGNEYDAPNLYLTEGTVRGTAENGNEAVEKGQKLYTSVKNGVVTYKESRYSNSVVATYNIENHVIDWTVASGTRNNSLGEGETRSLVYEVKATGTYYKDEKDYLTNGGFMGQAQTGTHSAEPGYRSNVEATLTYGSGKTETVWYRHPVIRPDAPRWGEFILKKEVNGDQTAKQQEYEFTIAVTNGNAPYTGQIKIGNTDHDLSDGGMYLLKLSGQYGQNSVTIGLPEGCKYTITEAPFDNGEYATTNTVIKKYTGSGYGQMVKEAAGEITFNQWGQTVYTYEFTNTVKAYKSLTVEKIVEGAEGGTYEFQLSLSGSNVEQVIEEIIGDNSDVLDANGGFDVTVGNPVVLKIHPEYADRDFTITETEILDAWKTQVKKGNGQFQDATPSTEGPQITNVKAGETVTFKNIYDTHSITLSKEVIDFNPDPDATYTFEVELPNLPEDKKDEIKVDDQAPKFKEGATTAIFKVELQAGSDNNVVISGIPKDVTQVVIREKLPENNEYNVSLDHVTVDESNVKVTDESVTVQLSAVDGAGDSPSVIFFNKYDKRTGSLQIVKNLQATDDEATAFRFKIEQQGEGGMTFYKTIIVPKGSLTNQTLEIKVPIGSYKVTELDTMKYELVSVSGANERDDGYIATVTEGRPTVVTFTNNKTPDKYFTDTSVRVNKVEPNTNGTDGFHYAPEQPVAYLSEDDTTEPRQLAQAGSDQPKALPSNKENDDDTVE